MFSTPHEQRFMLLIGLLSPFPYYEATLIFKAKSNNVIVTISDY